MDSTTALAEDNSRNVLEQRAWHSGDIAPRTMPHWIGNGDDIDCGFSDADDLCSECAAAAWTEIERWWKPEELEYVHLCSGGTETDNLPMCCVCGELLDGTLTAEGIDDEIDHYEEHGFDDTPSGRSDLGVILDSSPSIGQIWRLAAALEKDTSADG